MLWPDPAYAQKITDPAYAQKIDDVKLEICQLSGRLARQAMTQKKANRTPRKPPPWPRKRKRKKADKYYDEQDVAFTAN